MNFKKYWLTLSRIILFKCQPSVAEEYWAWLYKRVVESDSRDYARPILVWYLLADALDKGEFVRAASVYNKFQRIIDDSANVNYREQIDAALKAAKNRELLGDPTKAH